MSGLEPNKDNEPELNVTPVNQNSHQSGGNVKTSSGLDQNIAGLLSYLLGFITGILFLVIEKENRFVRFHALQSIGVSVVLIVLNTVLGMIPVLGLIIGFFLSPASIILWLFLMYKAYRNEWFKLPYIGDFAEKQLK